MARIIRMIRWMCIFIVRSFPWLRRALWAAIMLVLTTISSLWKGVPYSANTIANEWGTRAHNAGVPTEYEKTLYWVLYVMAVATIFLGWVLFSFATVTIIKMIF